MSKSITDRTGDLGGTNERHRPAPSGHLISSQDMLIPIIEGTNAPRSLRSKV